jgi:hypothetical protein
MPDLKGSHMTRLARLFHIAAALLAIAFFAVALHG